MSERTKSTNKKIMKFQYVSHLNKDKIILCRESTADRQEYQVHEKTTNDNQITRTEKNTKKREQENYTIIQLKMKVHSKYMRPLSQCGRPRRFT